MQTQISSTKPTKKHQKQTTKKNQKKNTTQTHPTTTTQTTKIQTTNPQPPNTTNYKIKTRPITIHLFKPSKPKNKKLTPKKYKQKLIDTKIWNHYPKQYIYDIPWYKNMIITPKVPFPNFNLNFKK